MSSISASRSSAGVTSVSTELYRDLYAPRRRPKRCCLRQQPTPSKPKASVAAANHGTILGVDRAGGTGLGGDHGFGGGGGGGGLGLGGGGGGDGGGGRGFRGGGGGGDRDGDGGGVGDGSGGDGGHAGFGEGGGGTGDGDGGGLGGGGCGGRGGSDGGGKNGAGIEQMIRRGRVEKSSDDSSVKVKKCEASLDVWNVIDESSLPTYNAPCHAIGLLTSFESNCNVIVVFGAQCARSTLRTTCSDVADSIDTLGPSAQLPSWSPAVRVPYRPASTGGEGAALIGLEGRCGEPNNGAGGGCASSCSSVAAGDGGCGGDMGFGEVTGEYTGTGAVACGRVTAGGMAGGEAGGAPVEHSPQLRAHWCANSPHCFHADL